MTDDERRIPCCNSTIASLPSWPRKVVLVLVRLRLRRQRQRQRQNKRYYDYYWSHRIRISTVLGVLLCLSGALVFQQFNWLRKIIVHENGGTNRLLVVAPFYASEIISTRPTQHNEGDVGVIAHSPPFAPMSTRNVTKEDSTYDQDSGEIQETAAFLVFRFPNHSGQGTGNIMSGALAAQLLAEEFNRTLCHAGVGSFNVHTSFRNAFEWVDHRHKEVCDRILIPVEQAQREKDTIYNIVPNASNTIVQNNFDTTSEQSECAIRDLLSNHDDYPIVYYEGNTYPRWPNKAVSSPRNRFQERFKATQALEKILPWKHSVDPPPTIVVHLREGDDERDHRGGLDDGTLSLLAKEGFLDESDSNSDVFLVTNNVEWYLRFPEWSHPRWSIVHHSALRRISWGGTTPGGNQNSHRGVNKDDGELQMWADWYTLLYTQKIYHTFSDFSRSAARWNENIKSWTILGSTAAYETPAIAEEGNDDARILLRNDIELLSPVESQGVSRLVDRTTKELLFCGIVLSPEERRHVQEKKDKQLLDLVLARKQQRNGASLLDHK